MRSRFWLWIIPKPNRSFPRPWTDWVRLGLVVTVLVLIGGGLAFREPLHRAFTCNESWVPDTDAWQAGDRCIGLSDAPYDFGVEAFAPVMRVIDAQNRSAEDQCQGTPATVGVLLTMTDQLAGSRAVHELEGMAAGQRRANGTGCLHPLRLLVGQIGDYNGDGDPVEVAREMAGRGDVVAVAGIGLSDQRTAEVADVLAAAKIPMVADVVTAEGFDQDGSHGDNPDFEGCDKDIDYRRGIAKDYYYRVAFRVAVQVKAIGAVVTTRPDFIMVPIGTSDPYTCTSLPFLQRQYGENVLEVKFDTTEPSTVPQTAKRVCAAAKDVTIAYIARGRDLGRLLYALDESYAIGQCAATSVTVVSTSDGNRLRTVESEPSLEDLRTKALGSRSFADGRVRLLFTLVAGADGKQANNPGWTDFEQAYTAAGFDLRHVGDGWAVNAYDALTTIDTALRALPATTSVQRSQVNATISGFSAPDAAVPGAGGPVIFDNSGNRTGAGPQVVRLCPIPNAVDRPLFAPTVEARPGESVPACPR
ncbi:ABC-type branched-subunit amino acid transport system substrate-binding protein [Nocardia tenerifensis]|uniref:ABC-type branched-subunit amino acid transport system substrate-binding protein n=1 Tax=Nocardia tenerifensis TaxID=228006 RepID=A0A318K5E4_9NOCA|nr:ABC transporter substrate-binding protein [Nocardia tenerifensis]PXX64330.1 ABC-type branched-subunit amino acid transport system substrate-binding protein [Nocardia tenerifensis]